PAWGSASGTGPTPPGAGPREGGGRPAMTDLAAGTLSLVWAQTTRPAASPYILVAFGAYMVGVFVLGALAHHLLERGSFLKGYFLGDRQLNAWVLSLTYVATSVSAGSFVGFPSLLDATRWLFAVCLSGY